MQVEPHSAASERPQLAVKFGLVSKALRQEDPSDPSANHAEHVTGYAPHDYEKQYEKWGIISKRKFDI
jgi:hypothetical protein